MSRIRRTLLLALLALVLATAAPVHATFTATPVPIPLVIYVTQAGAGPTVADAVATALSWIAASYPNYTIVSSSYTHALCSHVPISDRILCSAEVTAELRRNLLAFP
jgi:hypothetical protein